LQRCSPGSLISWRSEGSNPFRVRAYRNAARIIGELPRDIAATLRRGEELPKLPGIGRDLAGKLKEIAMTGGCRLLDQLHRELPPAVVQMLDLPGIGPKRVRVLHDSLHVDTIEQLKTAARSRRIREVPGFGEKTELHLLEALEKDAAAPKRWKLATAAQYASALVARLRAVPGVREAVVAGSYRRARETVGVAVSSSSTRSPIAWICRTFIAIWRATKAS
jgi:DNA polymerase (family X)